MLAQVGQVDGYVTVLTARRAQGAVVRVLTALDAKQHTEIKTDKKGHFQIASLMNGDYAVTVSVDGQLRDRRPFFHVSPGRQDATAGNSAVGLIFNLKPIDVAQAEMAGEAAKEAKSGDHSAGFYPS